MSTSGEASLVAKTAAIRGVGCKSRFQAALALRARVGPPNLAQFRHNRSPVDLQPSPLFLKSLSFLLSTIWKESHTTQYNYRVYKVAWTCSEQIELLFYKKFGHILEISYLRVRCSLQRNAAVSSTVSRLPNP
jgi:hypothetical protein